MTTKSKDKKKLSEEDLKKITSNFKKEISDMYSEGISRKSGFPLSTKIKFKSKGGRVGFAHGSKRPKGGWTS
jgi:hypothetical protein